MSVRYMSHLCETSIETFGSQKCNLTRFQLLSKYIIIKWENLLHFLVLHYGKFNIWVLDSWLFRFGCSENKTFNDIAHSRMMF